MKKPFHKLPAPLIALALGLSPVGATAWDHDEEIPFDVAEIFFELNHTDGDLGIHALIDGEPWKKLEIEGPNERELLDIDVKSRLRRQGLTELFFESAEPPFESDDPEEDTLTPEQFFRRFPAGTYEVEGVTLDGEELESETEVTHLIPAPPVVYINGDPAAEDCDADPLPSVSADEEVVISWDPVTSTHPDIGASGPITIVYYEVVAEIDETPFNSTTRLPPDVYSMVLPAEIIGLSDEVKFEVLVQESSSNRTAVESCFEVEGNDNGD